MDLSEFLAVEVMGYLRHLASDGREYWTLYQNRSDAIRIPIADWNPSENIEQAMMCLEQFPFYNIEKMTSPAGVFYTCEIWNEDGDLLARADKMESKEKAISLACAHTRGWEE